MTDPKTVAAQIKSAVAELYRRAPTLERAKQIADELHAAVDEPLDRLAKAWATKGGRWAKSQKSAKDEPPQGEQEKTPAKGKGAK